MRDLTYVEEQLNTLIVEIGAMKEVDEKDAILRRLEDILSALSYIQELLGC